MKIFNKLQLLVYNLWNSWPIEKEEECYLKFSIDDINIRIDVALDKKSAPIIADIVFQLDSGLLTGTIIDCINQKCQDEQKDDVYQEFMNYLNIISAQQVHLHDEEISRPVIKPSQVFTVQPNV